MDATASTYARNFSKKGFDGHVETGDIRLPDTKERLYRSVEGKHIHLIAGGFPCQGFSMAGNRIVDDPRNSLYKEMKEIVQTLRPETVVMENVEGILSMLDGKVMEKIIGDYRDIGYEVDAALGMTPKKTWNGEEDANGGYVAVKNDGTVVCYFVYDRVGFMDYLESHTKLERPSTKRHEYASVYKDADGNYKIKLNLQIRFVK